jgi:chromosome segregation ATPase
LIRFFGRNFKNGADIDAGVKAVETQIDRHEKSDPDAIWREAEKYKSLIEQLGSGLGWEKNLLCRGAEIEITRLESDLSSTKADIERLSAEARESESARRRAERSLALAEAKIRGMETRLATARPISQAENAKTEPARKAIPARMSDLFGVTP